MMAAEDLDRGAAGAEFQLLLDDPVGHRVEAMVECDVIVDPHRRPLQFGELVERAGQRLQRLPFELIEELLAGVGMPCACSACSWRAVAGASPRRAISSDSSSDPRRGSSSAVLPGPCDAAPPTDPGSPSAHAGRPLSCRHRRPAAAPRLRGCPARTPGPVSDPSTPVGLDQRHLPGITGR